MQLARVKSSNVHSIGYDQKTRSLRVHYLNGGLYEFRGVQPEEHKALMAAKSKGSHLAQKISKSYKGTKIN